jgi:hypothetical protein
MARVRAQEMRPIQIHVQGRRGRATVWVPYTGTVNDICDAVEDLLEQQICCMQISESPTTPGLVGCMLSNRDPIYDAVRDGEVLKPMFGERQMLLFH